MQRTVVTTIMSSLDKDMRTEMGKRSAPGLGERHLYFFRLTLLNGEGETVFDSPPGNR
jgi:hypothetical protein